MVVDEIDERLAGRDADAVFLWSFAVVDVLFAPQSGDGRGWLLLRRIGGGGEHIVKNAKVLREVEDRVELPRLRVAPQEVVFAVQRFAEQDELRLVALA